MTITRVTPGTVQRLQPIASIMAEDDDNYYAVLIPANKAMYLRANDLWISGNNQGTDWRVYLDLLYRNTGTNSISVHHQSGTSTYQSQSINRTNTGAWLPWTVNLDNINFVNGQNNASDLRIVAGGADLEIRSPVLSRALNPAGLRVKGASFGKMMTMVETSDTNDEAHTTVVTESGYEARRALKNSSGTMRHFHFNVSESLIRTGVTNVTIKITYWDRTDGAASVDLNLQYNSVSGGANKTYTPKPVKGNTLTWKTATFTITDANFTTTQSGNRADFRIFASDNYGLTIRQIEVTAN